MNSLMERRTMLYDSLTRGSRRSGPCIVGGASPSLHHARQSVTGPIFTGARAGVIAILQLGFCEPKFAITPALASSGPSQSQDQTKASRPEPLDFPLSPNARHSKSSAVSAPAPQQTEEHIQ
jgi:hypothetical protein